MSGGPLRLERPRARDRAGIEAGDQPRSRTGSAASRLPPIPRGRVCRRAANATSSRASGKSSRSTATRTRSSSWARCAPARTGWTVSVVQFNGMVADRMQVTETGLQCLYELARHGPSTPGELARRVNLTSGAASRMVERLQAAGWVRRVPDPHDRRRVLVEPTRESLERISGYYTPLTDRLREHLADLGTEQLALFLRFAAHAQDSTESEIGNLAAGPPPA